MPETVLITGASSGIGLELARLFAADKSDLVLVARSREKLEQLALECREAAGVACRVLVRDLADPAAPGTVFHELTAAGVTIDVVVNCAGFGFVGAVSEIPVQRQVDMVQVNVSALTHLTTLFLPGMQQRGHGGVLNVGSVAGFQPGPNMAVYYATKAYVLSYTEALAEELAGTGVRVTCLAPGPTVTGFGSHSGMDHSLIFKMGAMDAATVARAGYRGFRRGRVLVIPGWTNRLIPWYSRIAPRVVVRKVVKLLQG
jgi:short-subunit dehydrogenase